MFWIVKRPKFAANFFSHVLNNNLTCRDSSRSTKKGYDRLTAAEDDANGNTPSPPQNLLRRRPPSSTSPPSAPPPASSTATTPTTPTTTDGGMDVGSTCSGESDYDHYMSQTETDDSDEDDDDDDDDDEALTCNVCDRAFPTTRLLASHQTRKRHYGCSTCENVFPTLMSLEAHKEETSHWSDDDLFLDDDDDLDGLYDDEINEEEREKLL